VSTAALACGLVAVGCCDGSVTPLLTTTLIEKTENDLKDPYARFMALGLGLTLLGLLFISALYISIFLTYMYFLRATAVPGYQQVLLRASISYGNSVRLSVTTRYRIKPR